MVWARYFFYNLFPDPKSINCCIIALMYLHIVIHAFAGIQGLCLQDHGWL
jgi:hypothetical protein